MRVLEVCQEFPNAYYPQFGTFIKQSIDSIAFQNINLTMVSPKPFVIPVSNMPYHNFHKLPSIQSTDKYSIHYPRYIYCVPKKYFYPLTGISYSYFVSNYIKKNVMKHDLIHAHFSYPDGYGMIKLAREWNVPFVISALGTIERKIAYEANLTSKFIIKSLNLANAVLSVSEDLKSHIINLGIEESKIIVVPNGVNINLFKPRSKIDLRRKLNLPIEKNIVIYIGSLRKIKGVDFLIEAARYFLNSNTILVLLGRDDGLKKALLERSKKLEIAEKIIFLNQLPHDEIPLWVSASDLLVLPSISEGRPNVILEALASEVPVVATNVGGIPEIVSDGINGFLVYERNILEFAEKVDLLLNNDKLRLKMGMQGRKRIISENLTWEYHGLLTKQVYCDLLEVDKFHI